MQNKGKKIRNKKLNRAKFSKRDEFYTQFSYIEEELRYYTAHFRGKVVYCNCDEVGKSNFYRYFYENFSTLGLRKLIATCYKKVDLFETQVLRNGIYACYDGKREDIGFLGGDGDFRSRECMQLLKEADIVVTNPPFSLLREYIQRVIRYDKKFLILGNINVLVCKDIFRFVKDNKIWLGINHYDGGMEFEVPFSYELQASRCRQEGDRKYICVKGTRWITNLEYNYQKVTLQLHRRYDSMYYPVYDNYHAIEVAKVEDIPMDYAGEIGVPITFLDKYNPEQFEIVGLDRGYPKRDGSYNWGSNRIAGRKVYRRIIIKHKRPVV